jgi:hypothetical protein
VKHADAGLNLRALLESAARKMQRPVPASMLLLLLLLRLLLLLGSTVAQDPVHPEWCAGPGTFGDDGGRCPSTRTEATPCPAGCFVKVQKSTDSGTVAVIATVLVLVICAAGVMRPLMAPTPKRSEVGEDEAQE